MPHENRKISEDVVLKPFTKILRNGKMFCSLAKLTDKLQCTAEKAQTGTEPQLLLLRRERELFHKYSLAFSDLGRSRNSGAGFTSRL